MKQILLLFGSIIFYNLGFGQQNPILSQTFLAHQIFNPSSVGNSGKIEAFAMTRQAWNTTPFSHQVLIANGEIPISQARLGLGLSFYQDNDVYISKNAFHTNLSYKIKLAKAFLFFGLSLGYLHNNTDLSNVQINDRSDPTIAGLVNANALDARSGITLQKATWKMGLAALHLNAPNLNYYRGNSTRKLNRSYIFEGQKRIKWDFKIDTEHFLMANYTTKRESYLYALHKIIFYDYLGFGLGYRTNSTFVLHGSVKLGKISIALDAFTISYAYERNLGKLSNSVKNTHEIALGGQFAMPDKLKNIKKKPREITPVEF